jgi:hypothetical protein
VGVLRAALDAGADANARTPDVHKAPLLSVAAYYGRADAARELLARGADVNALYLFRAPAAGSATLGLRVRGANVQLCSRVVAREVSALDCALVLRRQAAPGRRGDARRGRRCTRRKPWFKRGGRVVKQLVDEAGQRGCQDNTRTRRLGGPGGGRAAKQHVGGAGQSVCRRTRRRRLGGRGGGGRAATQLVGARGTSAWHFSTTLVQISKKEGLIQEAQTSCGAGIAHCGLVPEPNFSGMSAPPFLEAWGRRELHAWRTRERAPSAKT